MGKRTFYFMTVLLCVVLMSDSLFAKTKRKRRQTLDFENELIEGDIKKPELLNLFQRRQFNFKRLIHLRENFLPEMNTTAENLEQSGEMSE